MPHDSSSTLGRPAFAIPRLSLPAALLISLGLIAIAAGIEHAMGRLFFCKCGTFKLWYGGRGGSEMSQHLTDWYSYSHVVHGMVFYWLLTILARGRLSVAARLVIATGLEVSWEIFENSSFIINRYRAQTISRGYFGDSIVNSVGDMLSMLVGFLARLALTRLGDGVSVDHRRGPPARPHPRQPYPQCDHADPSGGVDQSVADGWLCRCQRVTDPRS
jgi:hypothetical protein